MPIRPRPPREGGPTPPAPGGARGSRGITPPFGGLDPGAGQVAYALLTRPPLVRAPRGAPTARLACVRPAASVHPEPGSNSPLDMIVSTTFSSVPAAPGPPGPGPAGPSHRHAPTNAAPPGPPLFFRPPSRPESEREGSAPAPNRQAPGRKFPAWGSQGAGVQCEKFFAGGENFSPRGGARGVSRGRGAEREAAFVGYELCDLRKSSAVLPL